MLSNIFNHALFGYLVSSLVKADDYSQYIMKGVDEKTMLNETNAKRALHENTPPVSWSNELATTAAEYAANYYCNGKIVHSDNADYGENLALGYTVKGAVDAWYNEISNWDWVNPQFSGSTGHFTQLVWDKTSEIGCAIKYCDGYWGNYIICEYNSYGNEDWDMGDHVHKLKSPISSSSMSTASNAAASSTEVDSMSDHSDSFTATTSASTIYSMVSTNSFISVTAATFGVVSTTTTNSGLYVNGTVTGSCSKSQSDANTVQTHSYSSFSYKDTSIGASSYVNSSFISNNNSKPTSLLSTDSSGAIYTIFHSSSPISMIEKTVTHISYQEVTVTSCSARCHPTKTINDVKPKEQKSSANGQATNIDKPIARVQQTFVSQGVSYTEIVKSTAVVTQKVCQTCTDLHISRGTAVSKIKDEEDFVSSSISAKPAKYASTTTTEVPTASNKASSSITGKIVSKSTNKGQKDNRYTTNVADSSSLDFISLSALAASSNVATSPSLNTYEGRAFQLKNCKPVRIILPALMGLF